MDVKQRMPHFCHIFRKTSAFKYKERLATDQKVRGSSPFGCTIKNTSQLRNKLAVFLCYSQAGLEVLRFSQNRKNTKSVFAPTGLTAMPHIAEAIVKSLKGVPLKIPVNLEISWLFFYVTPKRDLRF